ncbi:MAG TPA: C40 family peptidase [Chitinophagaceae bacterium]
MKLISVYILFLIACSSPLQDKNATGQDSTLSTTTTFPAIADTVTEVMEEMVDEKNDNEINTGEVKPEAVISFAHTLKGVPYRYASTDPNYGFDCSGFITYVFNHFKIKVPRSSVDFTHVGREVPLHESKPGDLILFTGTDSTIRVVGHMGIITTSMQGNIEFIHSTSGKAYGVTTTPLNKYYMSRFVKVIRIFPGN